MAQDIQYGLRSRNGPIPLKEIKVFAKISTFTAELVLEQHYLNESNSPLEVEYKFPLDDGSTIYHFEAFINGKTLTGKVQEKVKAEQAYSDALSSGKGAFLLSKESEDLFSMSVGNLPPKQAVILKIGYVTELAVNDASVIFNLIPNIFPKYKGDIYFEAQLHMAFPIVSITTFPAGKSVKFSTLKDKKCNATISSAQSGINFTSNQSALKITLEEPHKPCVFTETSPNGSRAYALHFFPSTSYRECDDELVFVLDRSSSMCGASIQQLQITMYQVLKHLPHTATFNIVGFGSSFEFLFPEALPCDPKTIRRARKHIASLEANLGGTNLLGPLAEIYARPTFSGTNRSIFVLTDGGVTDKDAVISLVKNNTNSRVFSLGIGRSFDVELVKDLAKFGNGDCKFIAGHTEEEMEGAVISILHRAVKPAHEKVELEWRSLKGTVKMQQAPIKLPPIFNKQLYTVYGLLENQIEPESVTLKVEGNSGSRTFTLNFPQDEIALSGMLIHRLAAATLIREIEEKSVTVSSADKQKIVDLSVQYNLASSHASFVIIEDRDQPVLDSMNLVRLKSPSPNSGPNSGPKSSKPFALYPITNRAEVEGIRNRMIESIDQLLQRGERLETLATRSQDLSNSALSFKKSGQALRRKQHKKNMMIWGIALAIFILLVAIILGLLLVQRIIQVNQAGEHGAIAVYRGQIMVSNIFYKDLVPLLSGFQKHEYRHFDVFSSFATDRKIPSCGVLNLWGLGGMVLGTITALLGRNAIMACTTAIETAVARHMNDQLAFLADKDTKLHEAIADIQKEELEHRDAAQAQIRPTLISSFLDFFIQRVTHLAIVVAYHS